MKNPGEGPQMNRRSFLKLGSAAVAAAALNIPLAAEAQAKAPDADMLRASMLSYEHACRQPGSPQCIAGTLATLKDVREKMSHKNPADGMALLEDFQPKPQEYVGYADEFLNKHAQDIERVFEFAVQPDIFVKLPEKLQKMAQGITNPQEYLADLREKADMAANLPAGIFNLGYGALKITGLIGDLRALQEEFPAYIAYISWIMENELKKKPQQKVLQAASSLIKMMNTQLQRK